MPYAQARQGMQPATDAAPVPNLAPVSAPMPVSAQPPIPTQTNMPVPEPLIRGGSMGDEPAEEGFVQKTSVSPLIDMGPGDMDSDDYLPFPEPPKPIAQPQAAADNKCQPHVVRVNFDFNSGNTAVTTERGTLIYSPVYHSWVSGAGISPAEILDLRKLYNDASAMVGTPLDQFGGVPNIQ